MPEILMRDYVALSKKIYLISMRLPPAFNFLGIVNCRTPLSDESTA
jgi:hypothetical protein